MRTHNPIRRGLTLLELLVVIAILAILGGSILVAYDGLDGQAASSTAVFNINGVDRAVRTFTVNERSAPDELDALLAMTPGAQDPHGSGAINTYAIDWSNTGAIDTEQSVTLAGIADEVTIVELTAAQADALENAGIRHVRYLDPKGNLASDGPHVLDIVDESGAPAEVGNPHAADIPNRIFDMPASGKNRGRGYRAHIEEHGEVVVWDPGTAGANNLQVGAAADDVLVAFGLGNNASMISASTESSAVGRTNLAEAPYDGEVDKDQYGRCILLYNVGPNGSEFAKAKLQTVVCARGEFLDEEYADAIGQAE